MDSMLSAIQKRRGLIGAASEEAQAPEQGMMAKGDPALEMKNLITSLSDVQKQALLKMLVSDQQGQSMETAEIEEGKEPGVGEEIALEEEMSDDEGDEHESEEEIMESMISSADKQRADNGSTPRNLGERMKIALASKLKKKG